MHANQAIRRAALLKTSLALAPVLATSKLLGMMENNLMERPARSQKRLTYQSQSNSGFKTTTANTST
jgi:hypothetical protein